MSIEKIIETLDPKEVSKIKEKLSKEDCSHDRLDEFSSRDLELHGLNCPCPKCSRFKF